VKRFFLGTLAAITVVVAAMWLEGENLLALFLPSALLITLLSPLCAVLAVWDLRAWGDAWRDAFAASPEEARRERSAKLWDFLEKSFYIAGILGFIAGAIIVLASPGSMAEHFSADLVSPLWGILFAIIARILKYRVLTRD